MVVYYGASTNPKAPVSASARTVSSNRRECYTKQGPNPLLVSGHSPETLQLPSRQPTMAWVLARHGSDDMSGAHAINHHLNDSLHNNGDTFQHHRTGSGDFTEEFAVVTDTTCRSKATIVIIHARRDRRIVHHAPNEGSSQRICDVLEVFPSMLE